MPFFVTSFKQLAPFSIGLFVYLFFNCSSLYILDTSSLLDKHFANIFSLSLDYYNFLNVLMTIIY